MGDAEAEEGGRKAGRGTKGGDSWCKVDVDGNTRTNEKPGVGGAFMVQMHVEAR